MSELVAIPEEVSEIHTDGKQWERKQPDAEIKTAKDTEQQTRGEARRVGGGEDN